MMSKKGSQIPREFRDQGQALVPGWVRGEISKLINRMDGTHCETMVSAVILLDTEGFAAGSIEQSTNLSVEQAGVLMLQGYVRMAGLALINVLGNVHAALENPGHPIKAMRVEDQPGAGRQLYEAVLRNFLNDILTYAGQTLREKNDDSAKRLLEVISVWRKIAVSPIKFTEEKSDKEHACEK